MEGKARRAANGWSAYNDEISIRPRAFEFAVVHKDDTLASETWRLALVQARFRETRDETMEPTLVNMQHIVSVACSAT